jgi:hypothetical protein
MSSINGVIRQVLDTEQNETNMEDSNHFFNSPSIVASRTFFTLLYKHAELLSSGNTHVKKLNGQQQQQHCV